MKPYSEIRTDRLRAALDEHKKKACCSSCAKGGPCEGGKTEAKAEKSAAQDRSFIDRVVSRLTGNP